MIFGLGQKGLKRIVFDQDIQTGFVYVHFCKKMNWMSEFNNLSGFLLFQDLTFPFEFSLQLEVREIVRKSCCELSRKITVCLIVLLSESNKMSRVVFSLLSESNKMIRSLKYLLVAK